MAHLPLYRIPQPQPRFDQRATSHRPETMPANLNFRVIAHHPQRLIRSVFTHRLTRIMIANKNQLTIATELMNLLKDC